MPSIDVRIESDYDLGPGSIQNALVGRFPSENFTVTALPAPDDASDMIACGPGLDGQAHGPGVMTDEEREVVKSPLLPWFYVSLYKDLVKVARRHGYALCVHGSLNRDLDVVAVPWTSDAIDADELAEALRHECDGKYSNNSPKPHGRKAWAFQLGGGPWVDLSVMPRRKPAPDAIRCPKCAGQMDATEVASGFDHVCGRCGNHVPHLRHPAATQEPAPDEGEHMNLLIYRDAALKVLGEYWDTQSHAVPWADVERVLMTLPAIDPDAPDPDATCATCPNHRDDRRWTIDERPNECHLNPPHADLGGGCWPRVRDDDWCMEHPARKAVPDD
jgi:hypothetical protein